MQLRALMLCAAALLLMACNGGDDGTVGTGSGGDPPPSGTALTIFGAAQKGPFVIGSEVLLSQLQPNGIPSANTVPR